MHATLARAGYAHYETSAYAKPDRQCRHNINYWQFGDYLGIGAGAHTKLSFPDRIVRQLRWKQPKQYLAKMADGEPLQERDVVTRDDIGFEFMLNALRLTDGVPASLVRRSARAIRCARVAARSRRRRARDCSTRIRSRAGPRGSAAAS